MKAEPRIKKIEFVPMGEIAMGCEAHGIRIETEYGNFENLARVPVLVGRQDPDGCTELSSCKRYLRVHGAFTTWILDIESQSISVYRTTIRTPDREWSEEQAIYGKQRVHLRGFKQHYHLQFPFVAKADFDSIYQQYEELRQRQIKEASDAC